MRALPDDVRLRLIGHGQTCQFSKGQLIQQRGDEGSEFWYINSGTVQIGRFTLDGDLTLFTVLGPEDSFGEQAFLGEFPRMVDAIAGSDCELVRIGELELNTLIASDASTARILLKTMAQTLQQAFDLIEAGRRLNTEDRLVQALRQLCGQGVDIIVPATQQELANLVGVSRVSLGKALAKLESQGLISRGYGKILIADSKNLVEIDFI